MEAYLEFCQISMINLFSKNNELVLVVNYCRKKIHHRCLPVSKYACENSNILNNLKIRRYSFGVCGTEAFFYYKNVCHVALMIYTCFTSQQSGCLIENLI